VHPRREATLIVEVLSPSTQNYDRGEKFLSIAAYPHSRNICSSVKAEVGAEHHVRQPDGSWLMGEYAEPDAVLDLKSIDSRLRLGDLYLKAPLG
jgi:Uma2 family endonuclease